MNPGKQTPYETISYKWRDIKECVENLEVEVPAHLTSKDDNDQILFVIYPGRMKQVTFNNTIFSF